VRRFWRWTFDGVAALSLLAFIVVAALWIRSYFRADTVFWSGGHGRGLAQTYSDTGRLALLVHFTGAPFLGFVVREANAPGWLFESDPAYDLQGLNLSNHFDHDTRLHRLGIAFNCVFLSRHGLKFIDLTVFTPHWLIALATLPLPAVWLIRWCQRRAAYRAGLCRACGYDLRATPDRCPECGAIPMKK
jgi:hypothetical protein